MINIKFHSEFSHNHFHPKENLTALHEQIVRMTVIELLSYLLRNCYKHSVINQLYLIIPGKYVEITYFLKVKLGIPVPLFYLTDKIIT